MGAYSHAHTIISSITQNLRIRVGWFVVAIFRLLTFSSDTVQLTSEAVVAIATTRDLRVHYSRGHPQVRIRIRVV